MTDTATPKRRRVPRDAPGTPPTEPDETPLVAPETAPDRTPHPAPRPKETPRTMRDLRLARASARKKPKIEENPLREGLRLERVPDPSILVLFGATGDLAHRKVVPALYQLWRTNLLPHEFVIVAIGRREYDDDKLRDEYPATTTRSPPGSRSSTRSTARAATSCSISQRNRPRSRRSSRSWAGWGSITS